MVFSTELHARVTKKNALNAIYSLVIIAAILHDQISSEYIN